VGVLHERWSSRGRACRPTALGQSIQPEAVFGQPCLSFQIRPGHLAELFFDARGFVDRTYVADAEREVTFAQHERLVAGGATSWRPAASSRALA
jgi:hypothetical protein